MLESVEGGRRLSKEDYDVRVPDLRVDLLNAQYELRQAPFGVLVYLAGDDRLGVSETANRLNEWMDPRYLATTVFRAPTEEERERPWAWRLWRDLPGRGEAALYEGVGVPTSIVAHATGEIDDSELDRQAQNHRQLITTLAADGLLVIRIWLHLSKEAAAKRLKKSRNDPLLRWRVMSADWSVLENYDTSRDTVERYLRTSDDPAAPWRMVDGTQARHRDVTVAEIVLEAIRARLDDPPPVATKASFPPPRPVAAGDGILDQADLGATVDVEEYRSRRNELQARLHDLAGQALDRGVTTALVFEGWDAAGKGGSIRRLTQALEAGYYRVVPIAAPNAVEQAHHYLWRFWLHLPRAGHMVIFDRSWYGRVLVERVEGFATEAEWVRAYDEINTFERQLREHGIVMAKFWLHLDPGEQLRRFEAREQTPYKKYKITDEDYRNRDHWDDYRVAVEHMLARTSTDLCRWTVVPATDKRYARLQVLETVCHQLEAALDD